MTKGVMRFPTPSPPWSPRGDSLSQTLRKLKPLPTVWRLSFSRSPYLRSRPSLICLTWRWSRTSRPLPANKSWPTLTRFEKPTGASRRARLRDLTVSRTGPWSIFPCGRYSYSSKSSMPSNIPITFLQFGSTLGWSPYLRKDPAQPSSYRPFSLLDTIGKLFEKILLTIYLLVLLKKE